MWHICQCCVKRPLYDMCKETTVTGFDVCVCVCVSTGELTTENVPAYFKAQLNVSDKTDKPADTNKVQMVVRRKIYYGTPKTKKKPNQSPWCRPSRRRRFKKVVVYVDASGKELPAADEVSPTGKVDNTDDGESSDLETEDDQVVSTLEGSSRCSPEKAPGPGSSPRNTYSASSASPVKDRHAHNLSRSSRGSVSPAKQMYNGASESDATSQHSAASGRSCRSESPEKKREWRRWMKIEFVLGLKPIFGLRQM